MVKEFRELLKRYRLWVHGSSLLAIAATVILELPIHVDYLWVGFSVISELDA
jgi:hypothetical protein